MAKDLPFQRKITMGEKGGVEQKFPKAEGPEFI
jgi:hypothetical protein